MIQRDYIQRWLKIQHTTLKLRSASKSRGAFPRLSFYFSLSLSRDLADSFTHLLQHLPISEDMAGTRHLSPEASTAGRSAPVRLPWIDATDVNHSGVE